MVEKAGWSFGKENVDHLNPSMYVCVVLERDVEHIMVIFAHRSSSQPGFNPTPHHPLPTKQ